jgi:hypothetical protein
MLVVQFDSSPRSLRSSANILSVDRKARLSHCGKRTQNTQLRRYRSESHILTVSSKSEKKYQQKWAEDDIFRQDAPATVTANPPPRFYGTMAFPYMNGTLHAGHAFTASKIGSSDIKNPEKKPIPC